MRDHMQEAKEQLNRSQNISDYMIITTKLSANELNGTTNVHPQFSNYDHSLEANRLTALRAKYNYVEPKKAAIDLSEIEMSTEPYENIDPAEIPNLNGLFDDVFGIENV
jgi:hypothetical protein